MNMGKRRGSKNTTDSTEELPMQTRCPKCRGLKTSWLDNGMFVCNGCNYRTGRD